MIGPQEDSQAPRRTINNVQIEHVRDWTPRPFAEVVRRLEAETGVFDRATIQARIAAKATPTSVVEAISAMAGGVGSCGLRPWITRSLLLDNLSAKC
jgi:hypothetical protein